ncbi:MAG: porin [Burkholderiales bacterium]
MSVAAALGMAMPMSAQAQYGNVSIYGFIKADVERVAVRGVNAPSGQMRVSNNLSVLGFRTTEDLGGGLTAFGQIETNVRIDTGDGPFGGRNMAVGLRGGLGEVLMGLWESPLRFVSVYAIDPFTAGIFASNSIMGNGFATAANGVAPASFDRRQPNLIQYSLPERNGFGGRLAYAPSEEKTSTRSPDFLSGMVKYEQGPLFVSYGFEQHREYFATGTRDMAHRIGAAYSFGPTRVRFAWERLRYEPTASSDLVRDALQLAVTHEIGAGTLRASYVRAGRSKGNASVASAALIGIGAPGTDSGATQVSLGYGYTLSKRTELWGAYTRVTNGATASYNLSANSVAGLRAGQSPSGLGIGITHKF